MKRIMQGFRSHKWYGSPPGAATRTDTMTARVRNGLFLVLGLCCLVAGPALVQAENGIRFDTASLESFWALAGQLQAGETVATADYEALLQEDGFRVLAMTSREPEYNAAIISRVMDRVFTASTTDADAANSPWKKPVKRVDTFQNYEYLRDRKELVEQLVAPAELEKLGNRITALLAPYKPSSQQISRMILHVLPMRPDIRLFEGHLLVDAGLLVAAGHEQLAHILASVIYRETARASSTLPTDTAGIPALRATFLKMAHEGVASWLERYVEVQFDDEHPTLGIPPDFRTDSVRRCGHIIQQMNKYLGIIFEQPEMIAEKGLIIDEVIRGANSYESVGFAMAALIVARFGQERLQQVSNSAPAFISAYQEAAAQSRVVATAEIPGPHADLLIEMAPFDDELIVELLTLLREDS
ncbi:MAG: DUF5700 domain-containing putative Zn-dependent protease [bacterium]